MRGTTVFTTRKREQRLVDYQLKFVRVDNMSACGEKFADTKGVIRSRKSKDRKYNDQKRKGNNSTNNDLQNTT